MWLEGYLVFVYRANGESSVPHVVKSDSKMKEHHPVVWGYRWYDVPLEHIASQPSFFDRDMFHSWLAKKIGVSALATSLRTQSRTLRTKKAMVPALISSAPEYIISSLTRFLNDALSDIFRDHHTDRKVALRVHFRYSEKGLEAIVDDVVALSRDEEDNDPEQEDILHLFPSSIQKKAEVLRRWWEERAVRYRSISWFYARCYFCNSDASRIIGNWVNIDSSRADSEGKWVYLSNLYKHPALHESVVALQKHRDFFIDRLTELKDIASLITSIEQAAEKSAIPLCMPELLDEAEEIVAFDQIYPTHLLSRKDKIFPIKNLPGINGRMVAFTGTHGGGKTVASLSIPVNIYLLQSGLPVFGSGFRANMKRALGMVFLERGDGSTCEMILAKLTNILKATKIYAPHEFIVVIDELGVGTQEESGLQLGKDVLEELRKKGVSTLFSTQILELARHAQENLDAYCFKVDKDHAMAPGISGGDMGALREKSGFNSLIGN